MVAQQPPDLILLDIMMPGMDGYQVAGKIKGNLATKNIPVIMVTALDDRNARMLGLSAGAEDFLTKPVDRAELCVRVRNLLRLKAYGDYHDKYSQMLEGEVGSRTADLVESERLYRSTFDAAPVGIVHVGLDGQWLRVNQRLCDLLGYSREELQSPVVQELHAVGRSGRRGRGIPPDGGGNAGPPRGRRKALSAAGRQLRVGQGQHVRPSRRRGPAAAFHLGHRGHHRTADARSAGPAGEQDGRDRAAGVGRRPRFQQSADGHSRVRRAHDRRHRHAGQSTRRISARSSRRPSAPRVSPSNCSRSAVSRCCTPRLST